MFRLCHLYMFGLPLILLSAAALTFWLWCLSGCCDRLYSQCPATLDHLRHPKQLLTAPEDTRSLSHLLLRRHRKFTEEPLHLYQLLWLFWCFSVFFCSGTVEFTCLSFVVSLTSRSLVGSSPADPHEHIDNRVRQQWCLSSPVRQLMWTREFGSS